MMQATFASEGVRRNVLARIAADGPGLGPKSVNAGIFTPAALPEYPAAH